MSLIQHLKTSTARIKSSAVKGNVISHYHPHGDAAVYGAMKPLINWFEINMPLLCKTGNFGNLQGDVASADRYTEVGLSDFALEVLLGDLTESAQSVDWIPTYDNKELEPEFLPARIPLLLVNGSFGIGVGMRPEIPTHNINEVIDATIKLIDNPNADFVLIPDHCMACEIIDTDWRKINNGEMSNYTVRSKIDIVQNEKKGPYLRLTSIPNLTYLNQIDDAIDELRMSGELSQISTIEDRSTDDYCDYQIYLKKGADPNYVRETIWKKTKAMQTCRVNLETLVDGVPVSLTYRDYLLMFIEQRKLTKFRLYSNKHQEYETKIHERDAFITVLSSGEVDKIIEMIKKRSDKTTDNDLIEYLIKKYKITDLQASYIINARLKYLSPAYLQKYISDKAELVKLRDDAYNKIAHDELILEEIRNELLSIKAKYGKPRNCEVINASVTDIPAGMFKIIVTKNNFIKKIPANDVVKSTRADHVKTVIVADNRESILIFDEMGKVFKLPVYKIPMNDRAGTDIRFLIKNLTSDINTIIYEPDLVKFNEKASKYFLLVATVQGNIKKMDLADFTTIPPSGILYTKLDQNDTVKSILIVNDRFDIVAYAGKSAIRVRVQDIPHLKRNTKGSRVMTTNHPIEGISFIRPNSEFVVVVTRSGRMNKFNAVALQTKSRGKSGNQIIKLSKTDALVAVYGVNNTDRLYIATQETTYNVAIADIPLGSSISEGAKMLSLGADQITHCSLIAE